MSPRWLEYSVRVQPHHTDYAGVVWHGSYVSWMEEARIAALRTVGIEFAELVKLDCDLPVVELSIRYHRAVQMGAIAVVRSRLAAMEKVRLHWEQNIYGPEQSLPYITAQVTLVPLNRTQNRIIRNLPAQLQHALTQLMTPLDRKVHPITMGAANPM